MIIWESSRSCSFKDQNPKAGQGLLLGQGQAQAEEHSRCER